MKKFINLVFALTFSTIYSQSKKEQIQSLNFKIDSLNNVIINNNIRYNEEVNNIKKENIQLSNAISKDKITFEEKISSVNDSLLILNNFNKNLNVKITKQKELIELFNNALSIEDREFDAIKDAKLYSQILFLKMLYYPRNKISKYEVYFHLIIGNRLINAKPTDDEKKIFEKEMYDNYVYFLENFSDVKQSEIKKLKSEWKMNMFDVIVENLKDNSFFSDNLNSNNLLTDVKNKDLINLVIKNN
jgi:hypothetical protein